MIHHNTYSIPDYIHDRAPEPRCPVNPAALFKFTRALHKGHHVAFDPAQAAALPELFRRCGLYAPDRRDTLRREPMAVCDSRTARIGSLIDFCDKWLLLMDCPAHYAAALGYLHTTLSIPLVSAHGDYGTLSFDPSKQSYCFIGKGHAISFTSRRHTDLLNLALPLLDWENLFQPIAHHFPSPKLPRLCYRSTFKVTPA